MSLKFLQISIILADHSELPQDGLSLSSGRVSLRDIVDNISVQSHRLYHIGTSNISRSNLLRINSDKPYQLYEVLFSNLLNRCQSVVPGHNFRFKNPLYSLDAIDDRSMFIGFSLG